VDPAGALVAARGSASSGISRAIGRQPRGLQRVAPIMY